MKGRVMKRSEKKNPLESELSKEAFLFDSLELIVDGIAKTFGPRCEESVIAAVKPGVRICDLQKIARDIAEKAGYGEYYFPTGFGHGIGTSIAEMPILCEGNEAPIEAGNTFALEPMIVIEGLGTGCFEDVIAVTETGGLDLSIARKRTR